MVPAAASEVNVVSSPAIAFAPFALHSSQGFLFYGRRKSIPQGLLSAKKKQTRHFSMRIKRKKAGGQLPPFLLYRIFPIVQADGWKNCKTMPRLHVCPFAHNRREEAKYLEKKMVDFPVGAALSAVGRLRRGGKRAARSIPIHDPGRNDHAAYGKPNARTRIAG